VDSLEIRLTEARAGYLDKLGITGDLQTDIIDKIEGWGDLSRIANIDTSGLSSLGETMDTISRAVDSAIADINRVAAMNDELKGPGVMAVAIESISGRVAIIAEKLGEISQVQGLKIDEVYKNFEEQSIDVDYLKNKIMEIKAMVEVQKDINEAEGDEPIVKSWLEFKK